MSRWDYLPKSNLVFKNIFNLSAYLEHKEQKKLRNQSQKSVNQPQNPSAAVPGFNPPRISNNNLPSSSTINPSSSNINLLDLSGSTGVSSPVSSSALEPADALPPTAESVAASAAIPGVFPEKQQHDARGRFMKKTGKQGKQITPIQKLNNIKSSAVSKLKKSIKQKMALIQKLE